ncbi:MAG: hypothetical protein WC713_12655, partial [Candidatus Methylomirabilota bacterium]
MPNTDWDLLDAGQLERYAEYLLKAEFSSHGFDILESSPGRFAAVTGDKRLEVAWKAARGFKPVSFPRDGVSVAILAVFLEGKPPMLYMVPAAAWGKPDALFGRKGERLALNVGKA